MCPPNNVPHKTIRQVSFSRIDRCCFDYSVRNSLVTSKSCWKLYVLDLFFGPDFWFNPLAVLVSI